MNVWERIIKHFPGSSVIWNVFGCNVVLACCIASCMFLHIQLCYLSVVSRVETSKILKNCISNAVSVISLAWNVTFTSFICFSVVPVLIWVLIPLWPRQQFSWSVWVWAVFGAPLPGCRGPQVSVRGSRAAPEGRFSPESRRLTRTAGRRCEEHSRPVGWMNSSLENTVGILWCRPNTWIWSGWLWRFCPLSRV